MPKNTLKIVGKIWHRIISITIKRKILVQISMIHNKIKYRIRRTYRIVDWGVQCTGLKSISPPQVNYPVQLVS